MEVEWCRSESRREERGDIEESRGRSGFVETTTFDDAMPLFKPSFFPSSFSFFLFNCHQRTYTTSISFLINLFTLSLYGHKPHKEKSKASIMYLFFFFMLFFSTYSLLSLYMPLMNLILISLFLFHTHMSFVIYSLFLTSSSLI